MNKLNKLANIFKSSVRKIVRPELAPQPEQETSDTRVSDPRFEIDWGNVGGVVPEPTQYDYEETQEETSALPPLPPSPTSPAPATLQDLEVPAKEEKKDLKSPFEEARKERVERALNLPGYGEYSGPGNIKKKKKKTVQKDPNKLEMPDLEGKSPEERKELIDEYYQKKQELYLKRKEREERDKKIREEIGGGDLGKPSRKGPDPTGGTKYTEFEKEQIEKAKSKEQKELEESRKRQQEFEEMAFEQAGERLPELNSQIQSSITELKTKVLSKILDEKDAKLRLKELKNSGIDGELREVIIPKTSVNKRPERRWVVVKPGETGISEIVGDLYRAMSNKITIEDSTKSRSERLREVSDREKRFQELLDEVVPKEYGKDTGRYGKLTNVDMPKEKKEEYQRPQRFRDFDERKK